MSHDQVNRFLRTSALPVNQLRGRGQPLLADSPEAFLLVDDRGQAKRYSPFIGLVRSLVRGLVRGLGLVNRVHRLSRPM